MPLAALPGNMQTVRPPGHQAAATLSRQAFNARILYWLLAGSIAREYGCAAQNGSRA